jgi:hypothetical protein
MYDVSSYRRNPNTSGLVPMLGQGGNAMKRKSRCCSGAVGVETFVRAHRDRATEPITGPDARRNKE